MRKITHPPDGDTYHLHLMWPKQGFDVGELSEDAPDDFEGLDASAAHVANLLSTEPAGSKFFHFNAYKLSEKYSLFSDSNLGAQCYLKVNMGP